MRSNTVLFAVIFVQILETLASGEGIDVRRKRDYTVYAYDDTEPPPHSFEEDSCKNMVLKSDWKKVYKASKCEQLVEESVELIPDSAFIQFVPSSVRVMRCAGMCNNQQTCIPVEGGTRNITIPVMIQEQQGFMWSMKCGYVTVEEHTKCACKCSLMSKHCNEKQMYDKPSCKCICMDPNLMMSCVKEGKKWNEKNCSCDCPKRLQCSTGLVMDQEKCVCVEEIK